MEVQYHNLEEFKSLNRKGYDGIKIDDFAQLNGIFQKEDAKKTFASVIDNIDVPKKLNVKNQTISTLLYTPDKQLFKVSTPIKSLFVLNEVYFKNFKAKVDGKAVKVIKANGIHRAVVVDKGEHTVEFYYDLKVFYIGLIASLFGFIILILMYFKQKD